MEQMHIDKRKQVNRACEACRRAHAACDEGRPCQRCVSRGVGHTCVDRADGASADPLLAGLPHRRRRRRLHSGLLDASGQPLDAESAKRQRKLLKRQRKLAQEAAAAAAVNGHPATPMPPKIVRGVGRPPKALREQKLAAIAAAEALAAKTAHAPAYYAAQPTPTAASAAATALASSAAPATASAPAAAAAPVHPAPPALHFSFTRGEVPHWVTSMPSQYSSNPFTAVERETTPQLDAVVRGYFDSAERLSLDRYPSHVMHFTPRAAPSLNLNQANELISMIDRSIPNPLSTSSFVESACPNDFSDTDLTPYPADSDLYDDNWSINHQFLLV